MINIQFIKQNERPLADIFSSIKKKKLLNINFKSNMIFFSLNINFVVFLIYIFEPNG